MKIALQRPIAFFDLETTGVNVVHDRIVEIAILKVMPNGEKIRKRMLVNPEMPIPKQASDIHGITNEMVANAPTFKEIANEVIQFLDNCDLGGYNSNNFDIPLLVEECLRVNQSLDIDSRKLLDVQKIFFKMEPRNLSAAYKFYCQKSLDNAHSAEADITATVEIFEAQLDRYDALGNSLDEIIQFTGGNEGRFVDSGKRFAYSGNTIVFNFGKHKGKPVEEVFDKEPTYYDWMMRGEFPLHTKEKLSQMFKHYSLKKLNK